MTARRKREVWERILTKVNAVSTRASRTLEEVKRKWKDLKAAVLKEQASQKKTGGGSPTLRQWSIPPISESFYTVKENFASYTFTCDLSPKKSFHPPKFLTFFSHRLKISKFHTTFSPFFFPKYRNFPLKGHPIFHVLKFLSLPKMQQNFLPPKMAQKISFPLKWLSWRFLLHSPHGMDAPADTMVQVLANTIR